MIFFDKFWLVLLIFYMKNNKGNLIAPVPTVYMYLAKEMFKMTREDSRFHNYRCGMSNNGHFVITCNFDVNQMPPINVTCDIEKKSNGKFHIKCTIKKNDQQLVHQEAEVSNSNEAVETIYEMVDDNYYEVISDNEVEDSDNEVEEQNVIKDEDEEDSKEAMYEAPVPINDDNDGQDNQSNDSYYVIDDDGNKIDDPEQYRQQLASDKKNNSSGKNIELEDKKDSKEENIQINKSVENNTDSYVGNNENCSNNNLDVNNLNSSDKGGRKSCLRK